MTITAVLDKVGIAGAAGARTSGVVVMVGEGDAVGVTDGLAVAVGVAVTEWVAVTVAVALTV
jgi:hypothetical protein